VDDISAVWEGDPIINLLISGQGDNRRVWIKTDRGKYTVAIADIAVTYSSLEYCMPLFHPGLRLIYIGFETESKAKGKDRVLVEKVSRVAMAKKFH
jgi:hypothetical protein